ncbi:hypothetical protein SAMN02910276_00584 [Butyrivibrio sp. Su6]|nr:hypothetical protein [Butyrivibrio sp. Su6]SEF60122.1 hypothetical protein SAMN02910276_00584 [Butyrivibrio sp. Su6]
MYYVTINKQFNNKQFMQFCKNQKCFVSYANCKLVVDDLGSGKR